jgi:DNA-binding NarL/FixJ family response regulator
MPLTTHGHTITSMLDKAPPEKRQRLSARETQVIEMATLGLTNAQIAQRLTVTSYAIKFHLSSVYRKLGVANRTEAAVAYLHLQDKGRD